MQLLLHDNHSLKGKRKVVNQTIERVRSRFKVSIAEIGDQNLWQSIELGFSVVSSNQRIVRSVMDRIVNFVEDLHLSEVADVETEILYFGEHGT